jgi:hypothetical protein
MKRPYLWLMLFLVAGQALSHDRFFDAEADFRTLRDFLDECEHRSADGFPAGCAEIRRQITELSQRAVSHLKQWDAH